MKNTILIFSLALFTFTNAQESYVLTCISGDSRNNLGLHTADMETAIEGNRSVRGKIEGLGSVLNMAGTDNYVSNTKGSTLLYSSWDNQGILQIDGIRYAVNNINYNIKDGLFLTKINKDELLAFDFRGIEEIKVNDDVFKVIFDTGTNTYRVFQVMYEDQQFAVLKGFDLKLVEGSPNPMLNRSSTKLVKKETLFIRQNSSILAYKGSKKRVLKYIMNDDKLALMKTLKIKPTGEALVLNN